MPRIARVPALLLLCAACARPVSPPTEQKPDPQAAASALHDAIQAPIDKAGKAGDVVRKAADAEKARIDADDD